METGMVRRIIAGLLVTAAPLLAVACSTPIQHAVTVGATNPKLGNPGWIGSLSGGAPQTGKVTLSPPTAWKSANLLVLMASLDGPDTQPVGKATGETHAIVGGTSGLSWTRLTHVSARQDWAAAGSKLEPYGASATEVWVAQVPVGWPATGTIMVADSQATKDDGFVVTVVAYSNGKVNGVVTLDGLNGRPEVQRLTVPACSSVYAATFFGKVNAAFTPERGYQAAVVRRAGDDTAATLASTSHCLAASLQAVGYTAPAPGNYWEMAIAIVSPAS